MSWSACGNAAFDGTITAFYGVRARAPGRLFRRPCSRTAQYHPVATLPPQEDAGEAATVFSGCGQEHAANIYARGHCNLGKENAKLDHRPCGAFWPSMLAAETLVSGLFFFWIGLP
jgi:hypothetical protein